jgi:hypothetical protein
LDIRFSRQHPPNGFGHNFLVVHEKYNDGLFGKNGRTFLAMLQVLG